MFCYYCKIKCALGVKCRNSLFRTIFLYSKFYGGAHYFLFCMGRFGMKEETTVKISKHIESWTKLMEAKPSLHIVPDVTLLDIVKNIFIKCKNIFNKSNVDIKKTPSTSVKVISHKSSRTRNSPVIPLKANPTKWSNILKQFVGKLFECVWSFCRFGT